MRSTRLTLFAALAAALACTGAAAPLRASGSTTTAPSTRTTPGPGSHGQAGTLGLRQIVVSNRFRPSDPIRIQEEACWIAPLAEAERAGIEVVLAVYPYPPREFELGGVDLTAFGRYLDLLARAYPQVRQYVIGNEPEPAGVLASAVPAGRAGRIGRAGGRSPRRGVRHAQGDRPVARASSAWACPQGATTTRSRPATPRSRPCASSRARPLVPLERAHEAADGRLQLPPVPELGARLAGQGYAWPNAGFANLDRIKQALWDAFQGTAQPTTLSGLQLYLDELGWQVDTSWSAAYTGRENVRVTSEAQQESIYADVVRRAACDPTIAAVNFFGLDDDRERDIGWQAGLYRADGTPRGSAASVPARSRRPNGRDAAAT